VCAACAAPITAASERIQVQGSHRHTFANPCGLVYCIGCFATAPGCIGCGRESTEFPWFAGYGWTVEVCARCRTHLGWSFRSADHRFYGLVDDRLVEDGARSPDS
jgi:hypothetical protein